VQKNNDKTKKGREERIGRREKSWCGSMCASGSECVRRGEIIVRYSVCFGVGQQGCIVRVTCGME
jgi:hypothetical protein